MLHYEDNVLIRNLLECKKMPEYW